MINYFIASVVVSLAGVLTVGISAIVQNIILENAGELELSKDEERIAKICEITKHIGLAVLTIGVLGIAVTITVETLYM